MSETDDTRDEVPEEDEPGPRYSEEDIPPAEGDGWSPGILAEMRENPNHRRIALVVALVVGLALAWVHWFGLFVAGGLVGLVSKTVPSALFAGLVVGALVLSLHLFGSPVMSPGEILSLSPPSYVAVAAALLMPLWGSLLRGVV